MKSISVPKAHYVYHLLSPAIAGPVYNGLVNTEIGQMKSGVLCVFLVNLALLWPDTRCTRYW